jgi:hypothetical protein
MRSLLYVEYSIDARLGEMKDFMETIIFPTTISEALFEAKVALHQGFDP